MEDHLCILMSHLIRYKSRISTRRQHPARICMTQLIGASAANARTPYCNVPYSYAVGSYCVGSMPWWNVVRLGELD